jgi:zinc transport system substrate-binding protein
MSSVARPIALAATLASAALLAGCGGSGDAADGRSVVAAFYPLAWVTDRVAGDGWEVDNLTQPGQEPHDLELTIAQTAALEVADLVVLIHGFQPAVDAGAETAGAPVLDAADELELMPADGADHEGETGEEHDHGDTDPHFWLDPLLVADFGDAVADELAEVDPDRAQTYADNAAQLRGELEALDRDYTDGLAACERDTTVVSHQAFGYLERYGPHFEPIAGLSPDAEATAADLAHLQELITEDGVTTVFSERLVSPKMAQTLAEDLDVDTAVLDPIEGLSDETADEDYLSLMRDNLTALQRANGCS